eukprot:7725697-Pyramimonas_sp.AAC.1
MEEHHCHRIAIQEWAERQRQDRGHLSAASAQMQQIILEAQVDEKAAEEAERMLAISEAERRAMAQQVEREEAVSVADAQRRMQQAEAS